MAEEKPDFDARTEAPTPRRRQRASEEGQFAFSAELSTGLALFVGAGGLYFLAPQFGARLLDQTRAGLSALGPRDLSLDTAEQIFNALFAKWLLISGVLIAMMFVASLAVNFAQIGLRFNLEKLSFDGSKILPFQWQRLLSWDKVMSGLFLVAKVIAVGVVAWWIVRPRASEIMQIGDDHLGGTLARSWSVILQLAIWLAGTLFAIGAFDYGYQRWRFERSLYMTKQEIKEEHRQEEGDPQIKARIRRMQRETAQRKMFQQVPKATVVVTNPTHLAVALLYDPKTMAAPKVVAKGAGHIAKRIVAIARQHGVPTLERKPVAQALFKAVKIDREVPFGLYFVVAELLAYVYRVKGAPGADTSSAA